MASMARVPGRVSHGPREPRNVETVIPDDCDRELEAWVGNNLRHGFMAEYGAKFPLRAIIRIDLPDRGRARAKLRRVVGWRFGVLILDS